MSAEEEEAAERRRRRRSDSIEANMPGMYDQKFVALLYELRARGREAGRSRASTSCAPTNAAGSPRSQY
jgi:hypothetical protein